jgi:hypothetical protein
MLLSDDFRKGSRTHAAGERGFIFRMFFLHVIKKIHTFPFCFRLSAQQVIVFSVQSADIRHFKNASAFLTVRDEDLPHPDS